jgi:hypothetical protein
MVRLTGRRAPVVRQAEPATPSAPTSTHAPELDVDPTWRSTAFLPLNKAAVVLGISVASLYRLEREGTLTFRRIAGRTVVKTAGVVALADADEPWTASKAGEAARARRAELAKANWQVTP